MEQYKYEPIDLGIPTIRLLRLHRGNSSEISCEIFQAELHQRDDAVSYEALSYTWGSPDLTESIIVNNRRLRITYNLYLALQQFRHQDEDRVLWIDAVCIDQSNMKERGHQVTQMGEIYKEADRVIFWLGPGSYETNVFMESLQCLQRESIKHACRAWPLQDERWKDLWASIQPSLRKSHADLKKLQKQGLEILLERPWFRRVWILQEVAFAKAAIISCGTKSVSARLFGLAPLLLEVVPDAHCQSVLDIMPGPWREASWWSQNQNLYTLLLNFGRSEATESRDLVYALQGMSSDAKHAATLLPNYEKSEANLVRDVVRFIYHCELESLEWTEPPITIQGLVKVLETLNVDSCMALAKTSQPRNMEMLLKRLEVVVTQEILKAAALHDNSGEVVEVLLRCRGGTMEFTVDHEVLMSAARNLRGARGVFEAFLRYQGDRVEITEELLIAAAQNPGCGDDVTDLLLSLETGDYNVTAIAEAAASNFAMGEEVIKVLFRLKGDYIVTTSRLLTNAVQNAGSGLGILEFLFKEQPYYMTATESTVIAAIGNQETGIDALKLLLRHCPSEIAITKDIIQTAALTSENGLEAMKLLLEDQAVRVLLSPEEQFAALAPFSNPPLVRIFLEYHRGAVLSDKAVRAASRTPYSIESTLGVLIRAKGYDVTIDDKAAVAMVKNHGIGAAEDLIRFRQKQVMSNESFVRQVLGELMTKEDPGIWTPSRLAANRGYVAVTELLHAWGADAETGRKPLRLDPAVQELYNNGRTRSATAATNKNIDVLNPVLDHETTATAVSGREAETKDWSIGSSFQAIANLFKQGQNNNYSTTNMTAKESLLLAQRNLARQRL